jgi:diguanylate cyclase (GGDEF)-like protein
MRPSVIRADTDLGASMRIPRWRFVVGPFITVAAGVAIMVANRYVLPIPNGGPLEVLTVLVAAYVGGTIPGLASAAIAIIFGLVFIEPADLFALEQQAVIRFLTLLVLAPGAALTVGALRGRERRALEMERRQREAAETANRALASVHAALHHIDEGLVLLDENFRVQFMNAAFRKMWSVPDDLADSRPGLDEAARYMMSTVDYAISPEQREAFVADRIAKLRADVAGQSEVRLSDGRIIRSRSRVLPQGGRMLSYVDVTDIMRHSEELERLHAALEYVDEGVVLLDSELRARFMNAASRRIGHLRQRAPDEWPLYSELIDEVAANRAYAGPEAELAAQVAARKALIASGDPTPVEMRMADGEIYRFRCAALPDGGRMLLYSDITDLVRQTEQLEKLAITDDLTGLYNRRHFLHLAEAEWSRFSRHGRPMALLMLDIDCFKSVNDRFGHDAGDQVIVGLAAACREGRRVSDVVGRVGGEEFAILLPETAADAALGVAERLRERVATSAFFPAATGLRVTVSIGAAAARPELGGIAALMKEADQALYEAKRQGRNRVVTAGGAKLIAAPEATLQPAESLAPTRVTS